MNLDLRPPMENKKAQFCIQGQSAQRISILSNVSWLTLYSRRPSNTMEAFQWRRKVSKKVCIEVRSLYYLCIKLVASSLCLVRVSCVGEVSAHGGRVRKFEYAFVFLHRGLRFYNFWLHFLGVVSHLATQVWSIRGHASR